MLIQSLLIRPPNAGISFMGKIWDDDKGGRDHWIAWMRDIMIEAKRTLKPGGHLFIWALPRTSHWTATALEDAGLEIRDVVTHVFGSGFPKSHNISKAIDKINKVQPTIVGKKKGTWLDISGRDLQANGAESRIELNETKPTDEAKQWEGWGSGLKPAAEFYILCRKPLSEKTIADNVLKWGTGGINIDKSRIEISKDEVLPYENKQYGKYDNDIKMNASPVMRGYNDTGRWPANFIHDGSDEVMEQFDKAGKSKSRPLIGDGHKEDTQGNGDEGSPARFFYCSKASGKEKNEGLDEGKTSLFVCRRPCLYNLVVADVVYL